jgi:hypothetical protein
MASRERGCYPEAFGGGLKMFGLGMFVAGFASGWVVRSAVDSSHDLAVGLISVAYGAYDRTKRIVAIEREHLEDLVAEGKARYESKRARAQRPGAAQPGAAPRAADVANVARVARAERAA